MSASIDGFVDSCPITGRRNPRELYVKLFVINFTVVAAYMRLLRLRNEHWIVTRSLLLLLVPISPLWHLAAPPIALLVTTLTSSFSMTAMRQAFSILYGRLPNHNAPDIPTESQEAARENDKPTVKDVTGSAILQLALISQCCMSIYLFSRRLDRDAVAPVDYHILHLAIAGLCTSLLSLLHTFTRPVFPATYTGHPWLASLRGLTPFPSIDEAKPGLLMLVRDWCGAFLVSLAAALVLQSSLSERQWSDLYFSLWPTWLPLKILQNSALLLSAVPVLYIIVASIWEWQAGGGKRAWPAVWKKDATTGLVLFGVLIGVQMIVLPLLFAFLGIGDMLESVWGFGALPVDQGCLQAWKDPMEDYVWWLA